MLKRGGALVFVVFMFIGACRTKDPAAEIPTYLYIPSFTIENANSKTGMEIYSHKISDVWVYLDNDNQGAYELPALIPIAESGKHKIELRPGIKNAGIVDARRPYPYYKLIDLDQYNLKPGSIDTIDAITYYDDDPIEIQIPWEEQFEDPQPSFIINPNSDTSINYIGDSNKPELVFRGDHSAEIILEEPGYFFEMYTKDLNQLPQSLYPIYLELNYKCNTAFIVGAYRNNKEDKFPLYVLKEQEDWNKIYLDFSDIVQQSPPGSNFNVFIGFTRSANEERIEMYLDNIKLIHY